MTNKPSDSLREIQEAFEKKWQEALKAEGFYFDGFNWSEKGRGHGIYPLKHIHILLQDSVAAAHAAGVGEERKKTDQTLINLLRDFANTSLDERGSGWTWLVKAREALDNPTKDQ